MNVINNYTVFGFGETNSDASKEAMSSIFTSVQNREEIENMDEESTEYKNLQKKIIKEGKAINEISGGGKMDNFLKNLLVFQSSDFETTLLKKLNLKEKNNLLNYIIPTTSRGKKPDVYTF